MMTELREAYSVGERLVLRALADFTEGAVGYLTDEGVRPLPAPPTVKPRMYVKALEPIQAHRLGSFEEVKKPAPDPAA